MQCKKCGTEIKEGCLFCHNCGEEVQMVPDYEPELEGLQIDLEKNQKGIPEEERKDSPGREPKKLQKKKAGKKYFSSQNWVSFFIAALIVFGIVSFAAAYASVLKSQDPSAIWQTEISEKDQKEPISVSKPIFRPSGGNYGYYLSVKLDTEEKGTIYYTLDGSMPDETSEVYGEPIELSEGTTMIRAFVVDENGNYSEVASEVYAVEFGAPDAPVIFPESGEYQGEQYVRFLVPDGCVAYYTLDGSPPTESSEIYTGEFLMPEGTTTVCGIAEDENGSFSEISTVVYTCTPAEQ